MKKIKTIILIVNILFIIFCITLFIFKTNNYQITLYGNEVEVIYLNQEYIDSGFRAKKNNIDITDKVKVISNIDITKQGEYKILYQLKQITKKRTIYVVNKEDKGTIYLTFDDGPNLTYTPIILDTLKKYNVKATFFAVPKGNTTDELIKREYEEGHSIGIHSYSHVYKKIYSSDENLYKDISLVNEKIKNITGNYSYLYRYPGGTSNTISSRLCKGLTTRTTAFLHSQGFHYFDWNVASLDTTYKSSKTVTNKVINSLSKDKPNIVLMHDIKRGTAYAIEEIILYGFKNGYQFKKITMATKEWHHVMNN